MIPADVYREFVKSGTDWADKHGAAEMLEGALKSLKAQLTLDAKHAESCSMTEAESIALSSSEYRDAMQGAVEARTEANRAKVRYEATRALFEAQRTAEASERAAMRAAP
jgi:predicted nucleotide-binding protein (sugar kinase/HSP70/actin superfamily)